MSENALKIRVLSLLCVSQNPEWKWVAKISLWIYVTFKFQEMEAEYTRSVKQSILDYVLLDPAEQRRLGLDMPQPVSIIHGSIWSVTMPPPSPGIPPGICIFFLSRWYLPHPRTPDRTHIRFFRGTSFESNSDFCTIAKRDVFRTFINVF